MTWRMVAAIERVVAAMAHMFAAMARMVAAMAQVVAAVAHVLAHEGPDVEGFRSNGVHGRLNPPGWGGNVVGTSGSFGGLTSLDENISGPLSSSKVKTMAFPVPPGDLETHLTPPFSATGDSTCRFPSLNVAPVAFGC